MSGARATARCSVCGRLVGTYQASKTTKVGDWVTPVHHKHEGKPCPGSGVAVRKESWAMLNPQHAVPHNRPEQERAFLKTLGRTFEIRRNGEIWRVGVERLGKLKLLDEPRRQEQLAGNGYYRVETIIQCHRVRVSSHRVVFRHFHGDIPWGYVVDHKDGDRSHNHPDNLEAVCQAENTRRGYVRKRGA